MPTIVHATAISVRGIAVLLRGPSGSGKSDLALRCLMIGRGWPETQFVGPAGANGCAHNDVCLVADDQCCLTKTEDDLLLVAPPTATAGLIEVRGVGLCQVPFVSQVPVGLVIDLVAERVEIERLPDPLFIMDRICDVDVLVGKLFPFEASAAPKVLVMLDAAIQSSMSCS